MQCISPAIWHAEARSSGKGHAIPTHSQLCIREVMFKTNPVLLSKWWKTSYKFSSSYFFSILSEPFRPVATSPVSKSWPNWQVKTGTQLQGTIVQLKPMETCKSNSWTLEGSLEFGPLSRCLRLCPSWLTMPESSCKAWRSAFCLAFLILDCIQ